MEDWTPEAVRTRLFALQDRSYRAFTAKYLPTLAPETIIGVRLPQLRKLAREGKDDPQAQQFLRVLPHRYLEENHLHSFLVDVRCRDYETALEETRRFLPYVDNWAVCDSFRPTALRQNLPDLYGQICLWLRSEQPYTVRFALVLLLNWYLQEEFSTDTLQMVAQIRSDEYYVNMAISWYYSMALVQQYDAALPIFTAHILPRWIHNKSIQKAIESRQMSDERKERLRNLKA